MKKVGLKAKIHLKPMQRGDMFKTHGNNFLIKKLLKHLNSQSLKTGFQEQSKKIIKY